MNELEAQAVMNAEGRMSKDLDTIADVVLRYRPPEKLKAAKRRAKRKAQRDAKKG